MTRKTSAAFTLIELLVVISIIAVLASIALPAFSGVQERANQTKDLSNAKQVGLALRQFASDHNGAFPAKAPAADYAAAASTAPTNSNDALWWLFPTYLQNEQIFAVNGSLYTPSTPDNKLDAAGAATRTETLKKGENNYAYVSGLTDTENSTYPLLADGFTATAGQYDALKTNRGGVWAGKKAIVVFVDASGQIMNVRTSDKKIARPSGAAATADMFSGDSSYPVGSTNVPVVNPDI